MFASFIEKIKTYCIRFKYNMTHPEPKDFAELGIIIFIIGMCFLLGIFELRHLAPAANGIPDPIGLPEFVCLFSWADRLLPYVFGIYCCGAGYILFLMADPEKTEEEE